MEETLEMKVARVNKEITDILMREGLAFSVNMVPNISLTPNIIVPNE